MIHADNSATFYVGKTDCGQGTGTSFRQIMADELDIAYDKTTCIMGSTDVTVDQGGSGGSTAMERDSWPMRRVAAEGRRVLLEMGSARLGVPVGQLAVSAGVITRQRRSFPKRHLRRTDRWKKIQCRADREQYQRDTGVARVKAVQELKNVGLSPQRYDIPAKVDGSLKWAVDVKLPGMVHARNVKPPVAGAKLISIDESSVRGMPGFVRVVSKGNYLAVVCEREEQAINASRALKVNWEKPATAPFPSSENLFNYIREVKPTSSSKPIVVGDPETAFASAAKVIEADYDIPFQGHTAISPAHAHGGSVERPDDHLFERYEVVRHAKRRRRISGNARTKTCASSGWRARRASAAPRRTMRGARRRIWRKRSAVRFAFNGCVRKRRRGIRKLRRSR